MSQYTPIIGTLGYVMSRDGKQVLLVHRNKRPDDIHFGKYNGLGGKLEPGEDVVSGFCREVREEAGIEPVKLVLRGTINWPGFGKDGEDWLGFIFRVDEWQGDLIEENHEGALEWVDLARLDGINFWESDRYWLDMVFEKTDRTFHGVAPFDQGKMISWNYVLL